MSSNELERCGKYAKLAVLASITEPRSLSELGLFWYNENGRFYKKKAREEIDNAVKKQLLIKKDAKYKTNADKLVSSVYSKIKDHEFKELLCRFWCQPFSQQTYLCCEAVKKMFSNNPEKAAEANLILILNTPLILHQLQEKHPEIYALFVSMQGLEQYTNRINLNAEKNLAKAFRNLKEKTDWLDNLNKIIQNNGYFLEQAHPGLKIKEIIRGKRK